jgi:hypothetical protein
MANLGDEIGGADHHLRGHTAVERALPADQVSLDADDIQAGLGELLGRELAAGSEPQDDDVTREGVTHG